AQLGEFLRRNVWEREEDDISERLRIPSGRPNGKIIYALDETLNVVGYCHTESGIRKRSDPLHMITPEAVQRYETAARKQREKEDRRYKREHAAWERRNKKHTQPFTSQPIPSQRVGVEGANYGVLVDSYKDTEWHTARLERVVIQYVHPDAIMNIERLKETTDISGKALLRAMEVVRARYNVETGYLNGREQHDWHYQEGLMGGEPTNCGSLPREKQDNVFQKTFKATATVDELVAAIKDVYAAGEAFKAGVYKLQEERTGRVAEEARQKELAIAEQVAKF
ncbi:MAG: hypothetical protein AABX98_06685, partial [Nanoarchaeota archaeon]